MSDHRPLNLIVVDGWHPALLARELPRLPALSALLAAGHLDTCVSTFPTVTPSALATLVTGVPPSVHGVHGIMWYDRHEDRYIHYWPSLESLLDGRLPRVLRDVLVRLNGVDLSATAPTLFECLEDAGAVCAAVNFPLSRGRVLHQARLPRWVGALSGLGTTIALPGPTHYWVGDLILPPGFRPEGLFRRYGLTDRRAGDYGAELLRRVRPDFMLVYLNEHDLRSHRAGPMECAYSLHIVDAQLAKLLSAYGSWDRALTEARWIVVGDHAQTRVGGFAGYAVQVAQALAPLRVAPYTAGGLERDGYDVAIAPNDRSALVYVRDAAGRERVLDRLMQWPSADQVAWQHPGGFTARRPQGGELHWSPGGPWRDPVGQCWTLEGDWSVLDLHPEPEGAIAWGAYPDALARLMDSLLGGADLVVNARDGYEFTTGRPIGKGTHGSLAEGDSRTPLLTVGVRHPQTPARTRDVAPLVLSAFGLDRAPPSTGRPPWTSSASGSPRRSPS